MIRVWVLGLRSGSGLSRGWGQGQGQGQGHRGPVSLIASMSSALVPFLIAHTASPFGPIPSCFANHSHDLLDMQMSQWSGAMASHPHCSHLSIWPG